jgi:mono/diheme cytochrome c family protein
MKIADNLPKLFVLSFLFIGVGLLVSKVIERPVDEIPIKVVVPELSQTAQEGERIFAANCAGCHGVNAAGSKKGPPLVHDIYNPGHHADQAFILAARLGVRQHHWPFGNMPAQPQVSETDIRAIIEYVRDLQTANGIKFRAHKM